MVDFENRSFFVEKILFSSKIPVDLFTNRPTLNYCSACGVSAIAASPPHGVLLYCKQQALKVAKRTLEIFVLAPQVHAWKQHYRVLRNIPKSTAH